MAAPTISQASDLAAKAAERSSLLGFITDADSETAIQDGLAELVPSIQLRRASVRQATALLRKMPSHEKLYLLAGREKFRVITGSANLSLVALTGRQKELMREFAGLCGEQQHPRTASFFGKARRFWDGITGAE